MKRATSKHPKGEMSRSAKDAARARARAWYAAHGEKKVVTLTPVFFDPDRFEIIAEAMASNREKRKGQGF